MAEDAGSPSRCTCGHLLSEHDSDSLLDADCRVPGCKCTWFEEPPRTLTLGQVLELERRDKPQH